MIIRRQGKPAEPAPSWSPRDRRLLLHLLSLWWMRQLGLRNKPHGRRGSDNRLFLLPFWGLEVSSRLGS